MAKRYFSKYTNDFKNLCSPAFIYLLLSVIAFSIIAIQNFGNKNKFCLGPYDCYVPNTLFIFIFEAIYILFWTFILNSLCKAGYTEISWILVLLPLILFFLILAFILVSFSTQ